MERSGGAGTGTGTGTGGPVAASAERSGARRPGRSARAAAASERRSPDRCGRAGAAGRERRPRGARYGASGTRSGAARAGRGSPGGRLLVRAFCLAAPAGWENKLLSDVARGHRVQVENPGNSPLGVFLGVVLGFLLGSGWFVCFLFRWLLGGFVVVLVFCLFLIGHRGKR